MSSSDGRGGELESLLATLAENARRRNGGPPMIWAYCPRCAWAGCYSELHECPACRRELGEPGGPMHPPFVPRMVVLPDQAVASAANRLGGMEAVWALAQALVDAQT